MTLPRRHTNTEVMQSAVACDTAFATWLLRHQADDLTPELLRSAWRAAWVEAVISEHCRNVDEELLRVRTDNATVH